MRVVTVDLPASGYGARAATLTAYAQDNVAAHEGRLRPAVVICPGGGYEFCSDRESEPVALEFLARGFQAFVLDYTVLDQDEQRELLPFPQRDLAHAVALVRERAAEWSVDPARVCTLGFSAGAHLCASYAWLSRRPSFARELALALDDIAVDAQMLCYPVVDLSAGWPSDAAQTARISSNAELLALQNTVDEGTPRTFLWHTASDDGVPVRNSYRYAAALAERGIDHELHVFHRGPHGMSLATRQAAKDERYENARVATWVDLACGWLMEGDAQ